MTTYIVHSPTDWHDAYYKQINKFPLLTKEEEQELLLKYHNTKCIKTFQTLVNSNLRFVVKVCNKYKWYNIPLQDLIQEGTVGLIKAISKFDITKEVKLTTYADYWIKDQIQQYIQHNKYMVRPTYITASVKIQKRIDYLIRIGQPLTQETINNVAIELDVPVKDVQSVINKLNIVHLDIEYVVQSQEGTNPDFDMSSIDLSNLVSEDPAIVYEREQTEQRNINLINEAIASLDVLSRNIIKDRSFVEKPIIHSTLASKYNLSREKIRSVEQTALKNIHRYINLSC